MWLRQHCVTATGPGVSLEARRWRGRSRILLLSKASLGASGTRPITSTSYCVCFTRHTVYYLFLSLSLSLSLFHCSLTRSVLGRSTPHGTERGIGQGDSRFLFAPIARPPDYGVSFSPANIDMANTSEYDQDIVYSPFEQPWSFPFSTFHRIGNCFMTAVLFLVNFESSHRPKW